jgi:hypothetical protein
MDINIVRIDVISTLTTILPHTRDYQTDAEESRLFRKTALIRAPFDTKSLQL